MSVDGDYDDDMGRDLELGDDAVERLLTGEVSVDQLGTFVTAVRGLSTCDVPRPSAELSAFLNGETATSELAAVMPIGSGRWRRRVMLASVAALVAGSVVSAAAAEVLPRVVQRPVAAIVNAFTPFDLHPPRHTMRPVLPTPVTVGSTISPALALPIRGTPIAGASTSVLPTIPSSPIPSSTTIPAPTAIAPPAIAPPTTSIASTRVIAPEIVSSNGELPLAPSTSTSSGRRATNTPVKSEPVATAISGEVRPPKTRRKTKASKSKAASTVSPTPDATQPSLRAPADVANSSENTQGNNEDKHREQGGTGDENKPEKAKESTKPTESTDEQPPSEPNKSNGNSQKPDQPGKRADK